MQYTYNITLTEKSFSAIRDKILSGQYKPDQNLPQRELAESLNVTQNVVREALRMLDKVGLVEIIPKWGAHVINIDPSKLKDMYIVREALEGMAARLAAEKASDKDIEELFSLAKNCDKKFGGKKFDPNKVTEVHYNFHKRIIECSDCEEIVRYINMMNLKTLLWHTAYNIKAQWNVDPPGWHTQLIQAICSRDPNTAELKMREHVRFGYEIEKKFFKQPSNV